MQVQKKIIKHRIHNKENELDINKAIDILKNLDQLHKKANKSSNTKVISKVRGITKNCLQFEIAVYVIEKNGKILSDDTNLAEKLVEKVNNNIKPKYLK